MHRRQTQMGILAALSLLVLILDSKTALQSGQEAVQICIRVLVPSLFPFFVCTPFLTQWNMPFLRKLCALLRLPEHSGGILLSGFLGGYPSGAQAISDSVRTGAISHDDGRRMMAFCSNAGPSFLFGIGMQLFVKIRYCFLIWLIHILSAAITGLLTPGASSVGKHRESLPTSLAAVVKKAVMTTALVCGWVVLFRIVLGFCNRWFLWLFPQPTQVFIWGITELANGSVALHSLSSLGMKLTYFALFLSFGGLCVWLQTLSVAENVNTALYLPGKLTQSGISLFLSAAAQMLLPPGERFFFPVWVYGIGAIIFVVNSIYARKMEIKGSNPAVIGV